ncbi:hypothetical protein C2U69_29990 [Cupriavidus pinatubonensis]|nr:hypothetical protein C2U69_29990 [Cupriavidus pinatubonensis]
MESELTALKRISGEMLIVFTESTTKSWARNEFLPAIVSILVATHPKRDALIGGAKAFASSLMTPPSGEEQTMFQRYIAETLATRLDRCNES